MLFFNIFNSFTSVAVTLIILSSREIDGREVKVFKRGKIELIDETQFELPASADRIDFKSDPDLQKEPDFEDLYDELVPHLPKYTVFKNGKNIGFSRINISTRKQPTWSTPHPRTRKGQYRTWTTPRLEPITRVTPKQLGRNRSRPTSESEKRKIEKQLATKPKVEPEPTTEQIESITSAQTKTTRRQIGQKTTTSSTESIDLTDASTKPSRTMPSPRQTSSRRPKTTTPLSTTVRSTESTITRPIFRSRTTKLTTPPPDEELTTTPARTTSSFVRNRLRQQQLRKLALEQEQQEQHLEEQLNQLRHGNDVGDSVGQNRNNVESPLGSRLIIGIETADSALPARHHFSLADREQKVKSNRFMIQTTRSNGVGGAASEELSEDRLDRRRPLSASTRSVTPRTTTPTTRSTTERRLTTPRTPTTTRDNNENNNNNIRNINKVAMKPPVIQDPNQPYRGPTFNCRILDSVQDGQPSPFNDPQCQLSSPGFSLDGTCKCTYEVSGRDETGCATGFLYTCLQSAPLAQRRLAQK